MTTQAPQSMSQANTAPPPWLEALQAALHGLKFGQVVLTVHQGEVIQVDRTERLRLPPPPRR